MNNIYYIIMITRHRQSRFEQNTIYVFNYICTSSNNNVTV